MQELQLVSITMPSPGLTVYLYDVFLQGSMVTAEELQEQLQQQTQQVFGPCVEDTDLMLSVMVEILVSMPPPAGDAAGMNTCKSCYDVGYEQGQMDCEPDTTGSVTSDPHVSGLQQQRCVLCGRNTNP